MGFSRSVLWVLLFQFFITALNTTVQKSPGDPLVLSFPLSDPVEVLYNSTGSSGPSSVQICRVDGRLLDCKPEYTHRASLSGVLELRGVKISDSGVYTVRYIWNKEILQTYSVTVAEVSPHKSLDPGPVVPVWVAGLLGVVVAGVCAVSVWMILQLKRKNQELQMKVEGYEAVPLDSVSAEKKDLMNPTEEQERSSHPGAEEI